MQFLNKGALTDIQLDDMNDYGRMDSAMSRMGLTEDEKLAIYAVAAGVLHLGNIQFEEETEGTKGKLLLRLHYLWNIFFD